MRNAKIRTLCVLTFVCILINVVALVRWVTVVIRPDVGIGLGQGCLVLDKLSPPGYWSPGLTWANGIPLKGAIWLPQFERYAANQGRDFTLRLPMWPLSISMVTLTAVCFWRRRNRPGLACRACEYDLSANESGICPECGTPTEKVSEASQ